MRSFLSVILLLAALPIFGPPSTSKLTPSEVYQKALQSIVKVSYDAGNNQTYTCTGAIVAPAWAITAKHCIPDNGAEIMINDVLPSVVVKSNETMALLRVPPMMAHPLLIAKEANPLDEVIVVGYGYGKLEVMHRYVSGMLEKDVRLDGPLTPGMSGGPVLNMNGEVVGITQITATAEAVGCGPDEIRKLLK